MNKLYTTLTSMALLLTACQSGPDDPFQGIDFYGKDLPQTLSAYNGRAPEKAGVPAMYVDFSAGMNTAFGAAGMKDLMAQCFNTVLAERFAVYKLAQAQVTPLTVSNATELGQLVNDPKQYLDVRAPIQLAVEQIVAAKNDALLITDFEEWQNNTEVTATAYLKIAFSKWLKAGNSITFFVTDYQEGKVQKHVYFTVFTYGQAQDKSLITKLRPRLSALPKFDLATDAYRLTTAYPGAKTGGLFRDANGKSEQEQNVLDLQANYFKQPAFEFYPLGVDWNTIEETRKTYSEAQDLFRKLYVDLSNTDSYRISELEVQALDATADYERFARSVEVKRHRPKIVKGSNGENKLSDQEADPIALACYTPDGEVKAEYRYQVQEVPVINELFVLNKALFENTRQTDPAKTEIGVSFAPQFAIAKIARPAGLLKIAVKVKAATVNNDQPALGKLQWTNKNGVPNVGLYESVRGTLQEMDPSGRTIYTYYIKTTEQN